MTGGGWRPAVGFVSAWTTPALLLAVPTTLMAGGRDGLWLGLLFAVAPLFASLVTARDRGAAPEADRRSLPLVVLLLVVGVILWANLSLAGDVATWMGWPRWRGIVPAAGAAMGLVLWPAASRRWPWLIPMGLLALLLPVAVMIQRSSSDPIATWSQVASQPAFRFAPESPWVIEGRAVGPRRGATALAFDEEHRLTPVDPGPLRVEVSDQGRVQVQEWTLGPGQAVTLRPGDRLQLDGPRRLKFEANRRVPGAPVSGIAWADASFAPLSLPALRFAGLGVTLLGGAVALAALGAPSGTARLGVGLAGVVLLALLGWAECWALYAVRWAPELYLGGVTAAALLELPALVLRGDPWGPRLAGLSLAGLFALLLAASVALREQLAAAEGETQGAVASDRGLWGGMFALTALAALWPVEPWALMLSALGLGASCLAPLVLVGTARARPRTTTWAVGVGLVLFLGLSATGRLWISGSVTEALVAYPALVAAPLVAGILRVARRPPRA